jgi:cell volume regulation protein A
VSVDADRILHFTNQGENVKKKNRTPPLGHRNGFLYLEDMSLELILIIGSALVLLSIVIAKISDNVGVPTLVLFLGIGMLAGVDGPGGIEFNDAGLTQAVGIICLVFILFAGGLETRWSDTRPVAVQAFSLATLGVFLTALAVGFFAHMVLGFPLLHGLLLGAVISSTDAAAVFAVLRSRSVNLRGTLRPLLELESGSNDPMAVFLTVGIIQLLLTPEMSVVDLLLLFVQQMGIGAVAGLAFGRGMTLTLNRLRFPYEGMYPVFGLAYAVLVYGATASLGGSGFLAVYIAGIVAGSTGFLHQKSLVRFFDGVAWLSQICMFLALGLLVTPSSAVDELLPGLFVSLFLMFIARPLSVLIALGPAPCSWRERLFVAWVGLRGAVPIVLATFPLIAGVAYADRLFNLVFFVVLTSALFQGWSIPSVARLFGVDAPLERQRKYPLELVTLEGVNTDLVDVFLPVGSWAAGRPLVELGLPRDMLVVLIGRNDQYLVPTGATVLEAGDTLLALAGKEQLATLREILERPGESVP